MYDLSNGDILSDLERPITPISKTRHYLTVNVSETERDADIVKNEILIRTYALLKRVISSDLG